VAAAGAAVVAAGLAAAAVGAAAGAAVGAAGAAVGAAGALGVGADVHAASTPSAIVPVAPNATLSMERRLRGPIAILLSPHRGGYFEVHTGARPCRTSTSKCGTAKDNGVEPGAARRPLRSCPAGEAQRPATQLVFQFRHANLTIPPIFDARQSDSTLRWVVQTTSPPRPLPLRSDLPGVPNCGCARAIGISVRARH
jgi:hypothetical protein